MITFTDMTYCNADCQRTDCDRHMATEAKKRKELPSLVFLPTAWCDFSEVCGMHIPTAPKAA